MDVEEERRLSAIGVEESVRAPIARWLGLLREWNAKIDLTAARGEDELCDLMVADAVVLAKHIPANTRVVDVGTGAGAPGIALAILRPDLAVTLVEPLAKRVAFLRTVIGTLGRTDVVIRKEKGDATASEATGVSWDVALSRATLAPALWLPLGLRLAPTCWALLAKDAPPDIPGARVTENISYTWPLTNASRRAVRYEIT